MLIETDINELGDKRLNPEEAVIKEREDCLRMASKYRIGGQDELENQNRSGGKRLPWQHIVSRLQRVNRDLLIRDGMNGHLAVYLLKKPWEIDPEEYDPEKPAWHNEHRYVTGFPKEELPEYGHVLLDTSLLATREDIRGWRTLLIALIWAGALSYSEAVQEFGDVGSDKRAFLWNAKLREWRFYPHRRFKKTEETQ
jgi:hypothetical protein